MTVEPNIPSQETTLTGEGLSAQQTACLKSSIGNAAASIARPTPSPTIRAHKLILAPDVLEVSPALVQPVDVSRRPFTALQLPINKPTVRDSTTGVGPVAEVTPAQSLVRTISRQPRPFETPLAEPADLEITPGLVGPNYLAGSIVTAGPLAGSSLGELGLAPVQLQLSEKCSCVLDVSEPSWARLDGGKGDKKLVGIVQQLEGKDVLMFTVAEGGYLFATFDLSGLKEPVKGKYSVTKAPDGIEFLKEQPAARPKPNTSGESYLQGEMTCPGKLNFTIVGKTAGKYTVQAKWGDLTCRAIVNVSSQQTASAPYFGKDPTTPEGQKAKSEYEGAKKERDEKVKKKGGNAADGKCALVVTPVSQQWLNPNTKPPGELTNKYNKDPEVKGRTSWNANWPGFPVWEAIVKVKVKDGIGKFTWRTECSVLGHALNKDKSWTKGNKDLPESIAKDGEVREAWRRWLLDQGVSEEDVEKILNSLKQEDSKNKKGSFLKDDGAIIVPLDSGEEPCVSGQYVFYVPVRPMPASIDADGKPTVHATFYVCRLYINDELALDSGIKMLVVEAPLDRPDEVAAGEKK